MKLGKPVCVHVIRDNFNTHTGTGTVKIVETGFSWILLEVKL